MDRKKLNNIIYIIIWGCLFLLFLNRAFLSVELTDEVHGIASIYNIVQGKVPFMTSWDYHTGWCLLVPLFALFQRLSPDLEGIVIAFRLFYVTFMLISFIAITMLLKQNEGRKKSDNDSSIILFAAASALFYVPFSIFQINYNSFTVTILLVVSILLYTSVKEKKEHFRYFLIGMLVALDCIMYPTLAVVALLLIIYIFYIHKEMYAKEKTLCYVLGGGLVGAVFLLWIFLNGTPELFKEALKGMFTSPHEKSKGVINMEFARETFYLPIKLYLMRKFTLVIFAFELLQGIAYIKMKDQKEEVCSLLFLLFLFLNAYCNKGQCGYVGCGTLIGYSIFAFFCTTQKKRLTVLWLLLLAFVLTYAFTSDNKNIFVALEASSTMLFFCVAYSCCQRMGKTTRNINAYIILSIAVSGILNMYTYVYRDAPVKDLNQRVEHGIYKGLCTTPERKKAVEEIENELTNNASSAETICAVTRAPMIYLMARAPICAPQTWDAQFLARGYTDASPLLDYFQAIGETPDILIATSLDIPDFYNNEKYEINLFINQNYELYYANKLEGIDIYLWRKKGTKTWK